MTASPAADPPATLPDPSAWREIVMHAQDGVALRARLYGPVQSTRLPVVCLPGLSRTARDFHDLATALAAHGRQVLSIDYRGRGRSDHDPNWQNYTLVTERADVLDFCASVGFHEAVFVGCSRGGLITMAIAPTRPSLLAGVVLVDVGPEVDPGGIARIKTFIGQTDTPKTWDDATAFLKRAQGGLFPAFDEAEWADYARLVYAEHDGRPASDFDPNLSRLLDIIDFTKPLPTMWAEFDALAHVPLLLVHGAHSDVLSRDTVTRMRKRRPDLELVEVAGEGHTPMLRPGPVNDAITGFIDGLGKA